MLAYPVELTPDGKFLMVTFPDIPEANSQGDSVEDALKMAADALETALDFYFDAGRPVPVPSKPKRCLLYTSTRARKLEPDSLRRSKKT